MTSKVKNHFSGLDFDMISWFCQVSVMTMFMAMSMSMAMAMAIAMAMAMAMAIACHGHVHGRCRGRGRGRGRGWPRPVPGVGKRKIFFGILTLKNYMLKIRKTSFLLTPDSFATHPPPPESFSGSPLSHSQKTEPPSHTPVDP